MGRFDVLTQLDTKPLKPTSPSGTSKPLSNPDSYHLSEKLHQVAGKPANLQTVKDAGMQTSKPANVQVGKQVNLQTGKQVVIEKYSSYLTHEYKRELKRIAFESDRNEYEVLIEAVEQYLLTQRQPK